MRCLYLRTNFVTGQARLLVSKVANNQFSGALEVLFDFIDYLFRLRDNLSRFDPYYNRSAASGRVQIDLIASISIGFASVHARLLRIVFDHSRHFCNLAP